MNDNQKWFLKLMIWPTLMLALGAAWGFVGHIGNLFICFVSVYAMYAYNQYTDLNYNDKMSKEICGLAKFAYKKGLAKGKQRKRK